MKIFNSSLVASVGFVMAWVVACATFAQEPTAPSVSSVPPAWEAPEDPDAAEAVPPAATEPPAPLTLDAALELALSSNATLAASSWGIRAAEAREVQGKKYRNPEFDFRLYRLSEQDGEQDVERVLDAIEVTFRSIDRLTREHRFLLRRDSDEAATAAINELNARLREHGVGFQFEDGEIVRLLACGRHLGALLKIHPARDVQGHVSIPRVEGQQRTRFQDEGADHHRRGAAQDQLGVRRDLDAAMPADARGDQHG